mmetsp:Transcript_2548/g.6330  ORF Transcript_2548/g.6330 Transcript_2548/m.6330 type:complete len:114 (-) Transcript_2548:334-675(-)
MTRKPRHLDMDHVDNPSAIRLVRISLYKAAERTLVIHKVVRLLNLEKRNRCLLPLPPVPAGRRKPAKKAAEGMGQRKAAAREARWEEAFMCGWAGGWWRRAQRVAADRPPRAA